MIEGKTWLWVGLGAVVLLFLMKRGSANVTQLQAPDTSGETAARYSFAESGLAALADSFSAKVTSAAQVAAEQSRDNAYLESARIFGDTERFKAQSAERTAMSSYASALAASQSHDSAAVAQAKVEHKYDWLSALGSFVSFF